LKVAAAAVLNTDGVECPNGARVVGVGLVEGERLPIQGEGLVALEQARMTKTQVKGATGQTGLVADDRGDFAGARIHL